MRVPLSCTPILLKLRASLRALTIKSLPGPPRRNPPTMQSRLSRRSSTQTQQVLLLGIRVVATLEVGFSIVAVVLSDSSCCKGTHPLIKQDKSQGMCFFVTVRARRTRTQKRARGRPEAERVKSSATAHSFEPWQFLRGGDAGPVPVAQLNFHKARQAELETAKEEQGKTSASGWRLARVGGPIYSSCARTEKAEAARVVHVVHIAGGMFQCSSRAVDFTLNPSARGFTTYAYFVTKYAAQLVLG